MQDFKGRVAVVTGAASGIGLGTTERFLREGMKVVMADVEKGSLEREAARLRAGGGDVLPVVCDVRDPEAVDALAKRTLAHYGAVHVVFNNAGVGPAGPMLETSDDSHGASSAVAFLLMGNCSALRRPRRSAHGLGRMG